MATRRFEDWILRPVIFCVLSLLVEADCNFAQMGILPIRPAPNLDLLDAKRKHLVIYAQDFLSTSRSFLIRTHYYRTRGSVQTE